jgi:hypothetical protein
MLQGRSSARGGQMKDRTAALMFHRNNRKNISRSKYHCFSRNKKKFLDLSGYWEIRNFWHDVENFDFFWKRPTLLSTPYVTFPRLWWGRPCGGRTRRMARGTSPSWPSSMAGWLVLGWPRTLQVHICLCHPMTRIHLSGLRLQHLTS